MLYQFKNKNLEEKKKVALQVDQLVLRILAMDENALFQNKLFVFL